MSRTGGYVGYVWKALEKGHSEHPGSAGCTGGMFESFVRFGRHVCFPLPLFVDRQLPCLHTTSHHAPLLPLMHHKSLWCVKGLALGAEWVRVTRHAAKQAEKPHVAGSQQLACTHKEHQILTTAEAASFASQFWDHKVHPTKASQHEFLATCIDLDLAACAPVESQPLWNGTTMRTPVHCSVSCIVEFPAVCSKLWSPAPPPPQPIHF